MTTDNDTGDALFAAPEPPRPSAPQPPVEAGGPRAHEGPPAPGSAEAAPSAGSMPSPPGAGWPGATAASSTAPYPPAPQVPPPPPPAAPPSGAPQMPGAIPPPGHAGYAPDTYYAPGWQPQAPPKPPMDALAVASVPAGVLVGPVGIGLGLAGVVRTSGARRRGRGLAIAGTILGAVATAGWLVGGALWLAGDDGRKPLAADVRSPTTANAVQLVVGNCVEQLPEDGEVGRVRVVPCVDEHHAQVVVSTDLDDGAWPGQAEVNGMVSASCGADVLGTEAPEGVELVVWAPSEASWADGDRTGLCLVWGEHPLEGTFVD